MNHLGMFHPQRTKQNPDPIKPKNQMQKTNLPFQSKTGELTNASFNKNYILLKIAINLAPN